MQNICQRACLRRILIGRVRSKKSLEEPRATWKKCYWKTRCASVNGTRRAQRKNWVFHRRRCWRSCGVRGWKSRYVGFLLRENALSMTRQDNILLLHAFPTSLRNEAEF